MPDVSTITQRLRAKGSGGGLHELYVPLTDAVSAVEEAYRAGEDARAAEIVGELRGMAAEWDRQSAECVGCWIRR